MTSTTSIPQDDPAAAERAAFVEGLRDLAAFLELHTDVPTPEYVFAVRNYYLARETTAAQFAAIVKTLGGADIKPSSPDTVVARRTFGPVELEVKAPAHLVLTPRDVTKVERVLPEWLASGDVPDFIVEQARQQRAESAEQVAA